MPRESLEGLLGLFNLSKKGEVERHCQGLVITSEDFANVLLAGRIAGLGPYRYACHFHELTPEHLNPKQEELSALGSNGVGPLKGPTLKAIGRWTKLSGIGGYWQCTSFTPPPRNTGISSTSTNATMRHVETIGSTAHTSTIHKICSRENLSNKCGHVLCLTNQVSHHHCMSAMTTTIIDAAAHNLPLQRDASPASRLRAPELRR